MLQAEMIVGFNELTKRYMNEKQSGPSMEWLRHLVQRKPMNGPLVAVAEWVLREGNEAWYLIAMRLAGRCREYIVNISDYPKVHKYFQSQTLVRVENLDAYSFLFMEADRLQCHVTLGIDKGVMRCNIDNLHQADFLLQPLDGRSKILIPDTRAVWPTCDPHKWLGAALVWHCFIEAHKAVPKHPGCRVKMQFPADEH